MRKTLAILSLVMAPVATAAAQGAAASPMPKNVISIQPLSAMFTVLSAEYERRGGSSWTWGLGVTNWSPDDDAGNELTYTSGDVKLRYYPSGNALQGFSLGGSLGFTSVKNENTASTPPVEEEVSGGTIGLLLEYQWLLGASKKFAVALGAGAKMLQVDEDEISTGEFLARYPTARVSVGFAF